MSASGYRAGIYCSHDLAGTMASLIGAAVPGGGTRVRAWNVPVTDTHPYVCAPNDFPAEGPTGCDYPDTIAWQYQQNCELSLPGAPCAQMSADLSTSSLADPSAPPGAN